MNILVLLTDAFGSGGGIAKFNRDLLTALCLYNSVGHVVALPRVIRDTIEELPEKLTYKTTAAGSLLNYGSEFLKHTFAKRGSYDLVICGHINLVPFAVVAAKRLNVPFVLIIHGIDAWENPERPFLKNALTHVDYIVSVSEFTKEKFLQWSGFDRNNITVIPNCIELDKFETGPKPQYLKNRYLLEDEHKIILTLGRLAGRERAKGFDEILEVLPDLLSEKPDIRYMIAGDGPDRQRLEQKANQLGVSEEVIFAGYVPEEEKADHYRLSDVFAMPGRGEGFGIVYLEAMACGIPVIASTADASREAVLNGDIGEVTNPNDPESIKKSIHKFLGKEKKVPVRLKFFSFEQFCKRWKNFLEESVKIRT